MLERLERRTPLSVQRDDLTVDYCLVGIQPQARRRDSPIHPSEVLVLPGPKLDLLQVLDDQRPVAVELQLVDPVVALGEALDDLRGHGRDERGRLPRRRRAQGLLGPPLVFLRWHGLNRERTEQIGYVTHSRTRSKHSQCESNDDSPST